MKKALSIEELGVFLMADNNYMHAYKKMLAKINLSVYIVLDFG